MDGAVTRRSALRAIATGTPAVIWAACRSRGGPAVHVPRPTDMRVVDVAHTFETFTYRTPYQFGGRSVDRVTLLNVTCRIRRGDGREAQGFGSMPLGNAWAFPAASQDQGLGAMQALATDREEALVDIAVPLRNNAGPDEHKLVNEFNAHIAENPIPVA